jgi:hypothetical protein
MQFFVTTNTPRRDEFHDSPFRKATFEVGLVELALPRAFVMRIDDGAN